MAALLTSTSMPPNLSSGGGDNCTFETKQQGAQTNKYGDQHATAHAQKMNAQTQTQIHKHKDTQTHKHKDKGTQTHKHTNTKTQAQRHTHTHTQA